MIQDDKRENELVRLFNLHQSENRKRSDIDATLKINGEQINFELKSTTVGSVSTASPLTIGHLKKWKTFHWIIGVYDKKTEKLKYCYYGSPKDMRSWITFMENDIERGLSISKMLVDRIDLPMLHTVFGKKEFYSYKEAKFVFKNLYSKRQYLLRMDCKGGYSEKAMLAMFKDHNWHYLERGSWLNNPKIPKRIYKHWTKITCNHAEAIRKIMKGERWEEKKEENKVIHSLRRKQQNALCVKGRKN